jgi:hypothetical protein
MSLDPRDSVLPEPGLAQPTNNIMAMAVIIVFFIKISFSI